MSYVLNEVGEAAYVDRADGKLTRTGTGHGLFVPGQDEPVICEVEQRIANVGLDLLSLAPQERPALVYLL